MNTQRYVYKDGFILRYIKIIIHLKSAILAAQFVSNKAKGRISKRVLKENKARQIFKCKCISEGTKCSLFGKFDVL